MVIVDLPDNEPWMILKAGERPHCFEVAGLCSQEGSLRSGEFKCCYCQFSEETENPEEFLCSRIGPTRGQKDERPISRWNQDYDKVYPTPKLTIVRSDYRCGLFKQR